MIHETLMAVGTWDLQFRPDTPKAVRDLVDPFSHICVFPTRQTGLLASGDVLNDTESAALLGLARYVGVVTRPGPFYSIGGHGLGFWLGTGDRTYYDGGGAAGTTLPRLYMTPVSRTLTDYVSLAADSTGLSLGTVTDPTGGLGSTVSLQWMSKREVLDMACRHYDVEWRISPKGVIDAGTYSALWGDTPSVVVSRAFAGRQPSHNGLRANVDAAVDYWSHTDQVWVLGKDAFGEYAGSSQYRSFRGRPMFAELVVEGVDVVRGRENAIASAYYQRWSQPDRILRISSDDFDVPGEVEVGAPFYLYDPDLGLQDLVNGPQVEWEGQVIRPIIVRCVSMRWPVQDGMGIYLRVADSVSQFRFIDLTEYFVPETGSTEIQTAANAPLLWWDRWLGLKP